MKKRILLTAFTLGLLTLGSFNAYAEGWQQSGSDWTYIDNNNNRVYNTWKKGADDKWRWLGSNGVMSKESWVDGEEYYVDANGVIVAESWRKIGDYWYYFDSKGKKITGKWKNINNKWYYLDEEGRMLTGWILGDMYYTGNDGVMLTGWQNLLPPSQDDNEDKNVPFGNGSSSDKKWYYFGANGKKYVPVSGEVAEKKIDGKRYAFDESGALQTGWVKLDNVSSDYEIKSYRLYNADGTVRTGWYSANPPESLEGSYENSVEWFYFDSKGEPKASGPNYKSTDFVKINNRIYLFNEYGTPVYGLQKVYYGNSDNFEIYYFGKQNVANVQKGKMTLTEDNGESSSFYFQEGNGRGYTGVKNSYLYYKGKLQKADKDAKYQIISVPNDTGTSFTNYVVGISGKIVKNSKVKDADRVEYKTNSQGILTYIDGSANGIGDMYIKAVAPEVASR